MDKRALLKKLEERITADLSALTQAANAAHKAATHSESKAEDQYDTRGLEASYLAGAQSKRVMELQELLTLFRHVAIQLFGADTPIASTALVELDCGGKRSFCLLMPAGGGMSVVHEGNLVQVVTPASPLGGALLGRRVGDEVEVEIQRVRRGYEIIAAW